MSFHVLSGCRGTVGLRPVTSETQRWSLTDAARASWSLGRGQAEESRKTQSEIIQAIVSRRVRNRHQRHWRARIMEIRPQNLLRREKMFQKTVLLKDRLALQAQRRWAAGAPWPSLASLSRGWAQWSVRGREAAQPRPRPAAESLRLDNWLNQDAYFLRKLM